MQRFGWISLGKHNHYKSMFNDRGLGGSLWVNTIIIDLCSMIEVLGGSLWVNTIIIDLCSMIEVWVDLSG